MTRQFIKGFGAVVFLVTMIMSIPIQAFADETTYIVKLREKIISDIKNLQNIQTESKSERTIVEEKLNSLEEDFDKSNTEGEKDRIRLEHRKERARLLEVDARFITEKLRYVKSLNNNLELLNKEYDKEGEKDGLGLGDKDKQLIQETLIGMDESLALIKSLSPDNSNDVAMLEEILVTTDATYKHRFMNGNLEKLEGMIVYLREMETYLESTKRYLIEYVRGERVAVMNGVTYEIAEWLNKGLKTGKVNLSKRYKQWNRSYEKIYGKPKSLRLGSSRKSVTGSGVIGRWK